MRHVTFGGAIFCVTQKISGWFSSHETRDGFGFVSSTYRVESGPVTIIMSG